MAVTYSECYFENFEGRTEQNHRWLTQSIEASIGDLARRRSSSQRHSVGIAACKNRGKGKPLCFPQPKPTNRRVIIRIWGV